MLQKEVSNPTTLESKSQYINARIVEEKKQPATPASSSGKKGKGFARPRPKGKARLKTIKEDEEVVELIKPARNHLPYLDMNNDPYLINKLQGKRTQTKS